MLRKGGARFVRQDGKNHFVWAYQPAGAEKEVPVGFVAHGDGADIRPEYIQTLRRAWKLRKEDGVSDREFMAGKWKQRSP